MQYIAKDKRNTRKTTNDTVRLRNTKKHFAKKQSRHEFSKQKETQKKEKKTKLS